MPPLNIDAANATVITSIPYMIKVSASDVQSAPGSDHALWWVFTNAQYSVVHFFAQASLAGITYPPGKTFNVPRIQMYSGTPSALVPYPPTTALDDQAAMNAPYLTLPDTTYIKITVDSDGFNPTEPVSDPLTFRALPGPMITAPLGSLMITSDEKDWPAMVVGTDGTIKRSVGIASSEFGYMFDDGTYAILDKWTTPEDLKLYDSSATLYHTTAIAGGDNSNDNVSGDGTSTVYVAKSTAAVAATITAVAKSTGVAGSSWTLPANSKKIRGFAPNRAGTILYYQSANSATDSTVYAYDLVGSAALPNFAAAIATYGPAKDLFVLSDGSIVVGYIKAVGDTKIIRYNAAGTVLNTYTLPNDVLLNRFSPYTDDPDSILVWTFVQNLTNVSRFIRITTATGAQTVYPDMNAYETGVDATSAFFTDNTPPKFGISTSCPLLVPRVPLTVPDTPPSTALSSSEPCCDAAPGGGSNPGPVIPPVPYEWLAQCRGGGQVPTAADITDSEDWAA